MAGCGFVVEIAQAKSDRYLEHLEDVVVAVKGGKIKRISGARQHLRAKLKKTQIGAEHC